MDALRQAIERIAEGTPLRAQAEAELATKEAVILAIQKLEKKYHTMFAADNLASVRVADVVLALSAALKKVQA